MLQQFFTHAAGILWPFIEFYDPGFDTVIDPFAGRGHLLELYRDYAEWRVSVDIDPAVKPEWVADSLDDIPNHEMLNLEDVLVLTNPPFMYRAVLQKCNPELYQKVADGGFYDLYELCISRVIEQLPFAEIMTILPENFISGRQGRLRREIYNRIRAIQIHSETTCEDTGQPTVLVYILPEAITGAADVWIDDRLVGQITVGPDGVRPDFPAPRGLVELGLKPGQSETMRDARLLLRALDASESNRIRLMRLPEWEHYAGERWYEGKGSGDRSFKQIVPLVELADEQIELLIARFNEWVESWRTESFGLGLTSFRENSGGFRRKRLDFGTARLALDAIIASIVETGPASC